MAKKAGDKVDRRGRRDQDPAGRHLDRGLQVLCEEGRARDQGPGPYSQDFVATDKCKAQAQNLIAQGEGALPGRRRLRPRHAQGRRRGQDLGHRRRQGPVQRREARPDERRQAGRRGVYDSIRRRKDGTFGRQDLYFDLENDGMEVGKINPAVPSRSSTKMNKYKQLIIDGKVKAADRHSRGRPRSERSGHSCPPSFVLRRIPAVASDDARPRDARHHQAVPGRRRQRRRRLRPARAARCTPCSARTAPASRR